MWSVLTWFFLLKKFSFFFSFFFFLFFMFEFLLMDFSWPIFFSFFFFIDNVKAFLVFLTIFVFFFIFFFTPNQKILKIVFSMLTIFLTLCFWSSEVIMFYVFFELSLIPTLYMVFSWGFQPERVSASLYFLMYALMGSFPFLANMMFFSFSLGEFKFFILANSKCDYYYFFCKKALLMFFWVFSFLMKLPIYGVHLWLPKAHVEAPVYGSMVLAAVLLKLGGYGLIRLSMFPLISMKMFFVWIVFSVMMLGFISFRNIDLKSLMAYSSICHMAFSVIFFYLLLNMKVFSSLVIFVGHGFISSCLFFSFKLMYLISKSRNMFLKEGMNNISGIFYFFFFFVLCLNSSLPLKLTFFSEIMIGMNLFLIKNFFMFIFVISVFLIGLFKMKIFLFTNHGNYLSSLKNKIIYSLNLLNLSIIFFHMLINFISVYFFFKWFF